MDSLANDNHGAGPNDDKENHDGIGNVGHVVLERCALVGKKGSNSELGLGAWGLNADLA